MSTKHRKSAMGRSRDLGTGSNGKGDADRVSDTAAYAANYDAINWGPKEDRTKINPAWVNAPIEIEFFNFKSIDRGPEPALEDYEKWDR